AEDDAVGDRVARAALVLAVAALAVDPAGQVLAVEEGGVAFLDLLILRVGRERESRHQGRRHDPLHRRSPLEPAKIITMPGPRRSFIPARNFGAPSVYD